MYIFDSLSKKKKEILDINKIKIYVCGITANDICHIGHTRVFTIFDILIRYLKYMNFNTEYIRNITDIDDKIINKSKIKNINFIKFVNNVIYNYNQDIIKLNLLKPNYEPRVTDYINLIINDIKFLIKNNYAYINNNKDIIYNIKSYKKYGILSNRNKKFFNNFVIWKNSNLNKKDNIFDYNWISPWGVGRPGWHIECSTISRYFFNNIDIHGGGIDLIFPHHENELAQSININKNFNIKVWMHIGNVNICKKKMSKSYGNFIYLKSILKYFDYSSIKYYLSNKYYRNPLEFSYKNLIKSKKIIDNIKNNFKIFNIKKSKNFKNIIFKSEFINNMNNDLKINKVYTLINFMIKEYNIYKNNKEIIAKNILNDIHYIMNIMGLINNNYNIINNNILIKKIEFLIYKRNIQRRSKNWIKADYIRNYLNKIGIILEDKNEYKTIWYYK